MGRYLIGIKHDKNNPVISTNVEHFLPSTQYLNDEKHNINGIDHFGFNANIDKDGNSTLLHSPLHAIVVALFFHC